MNCKKLDHRYGILACLAASSSAINAGFAISFSSPAIQDLKSGQGSIHLSTDEATWFGSLLPLMAMCGSLLCGPLMDHFGRRPTILIVVVCFLASWITMFFASGYPMLFSGRGLSGLATGMSFAVIPVYISEVSPAFLRGTMGSVFSVLLASGLPCGYAIGVLFNWRGMAESGAIIACLTFIICFLLPESPYWLLRRNRTSEATTCLRILRGRSYDVSAEVKDIQLLQEELATPVNTKEIFSQSFMKPVAIGVMLMIAQQFSGVNAVFFYAHEIFQRTNFHDENLASILVSTVHVVALIMVTFAIDRFGRRILLLISAFGMMVCHGVIGACMSMLSKNNHMGGGKEDIPISNTPFLETEFIKDEIPNEVLHNDNISSMQNMLNISNSFTNGTPDAEEVITISDPTVASWLSLTFVMFYITMYSIGLGPIPFIALSEMLPQRGRGVAGGIGTMCNWICAFTLTKTFVRLVDAITTPGVFWLFSSICFLSIIFIWKFVPETKGKTLSQIQAIFTNNNNLRLSRELPVKSPIEIVNNAVMASPLLRAKRSSIIQEQMKNLIVDDF